VAALPDEVGQAGQGARGQRNRPCRACGDQRDHDERLLDLNIVILPLWNPQALDIGNLDGNVQESELIAA
jgi:hypothetical protein